MEHRTFLLNNRYRIVRELGHGSEGIVFLVLFLPTEEFRAVKVIHTGKENGTCRELEMLKHIRNAHLPDVIDVLQDSAWTYLVMEYVRGAAMDRILNEGRCVSEIQAFEAASQIAEALCYLQNRDPPICHLDIKPSNLICRPDGVIRLVDFGAAWKQEMDRSGMGTDGYAAPEQYEADGKPDRRTDIYGLGAVLFRMLSGKTYSTILHGCTVPNCSEEFAGIVAKCLEADPENRFQSAEELMGDLILLKKKKRKKSFRIHILGAMAMMLPALAFGVSVLPASVNLKEEREWNYESLLSEAGTCSGSESRDCYRRAVFMDPGRPEAYMQYLEEAQADGVFSADEDLFLRDLLHTVELGMDVTNEEVLKEDPEIYGQIALKTGLVYWYCSLEEDGKRIASAWFSKAEDAGESLKDMGDRDWLETAGMYRKLSSTVELSKARKAGKQGPENAAAYWNILEDLMLRTDRLESPVMRMEFCRDALLQISFLCADLELAGIETKAQEERILELLTMAHEITGPPELEKTLRMLEEETQEAASLALTAVEDREREEQIREETE